ncbi:hypothetical protein NFI96_032566 [Prochilodus magdalenae]|nr:hypothetical protein NFI96_032566 [Prochilodus magdalenae]
MLSLFSKISWVPDAFKTFTGPLTNVKQYCEGMTRIPQHIMGFSKAAASADRYITTTSRLHIQNTELRLILLGPSRGACVCLRDSLLGYSAGALVVEKESTTWRARVDNRDLTVIETPDLLGTSLGVRQRAQEALRSLQLASPGPHAVLLVLPTTYLDEVYQISARDLLSKLLSLVGEEAANYVLVVFACVNPRGASLSLDQLLEEDYLGIKAALSMCGKRVELVNISPGRSMDSRMVEGRRLLDRVIKMRAQQGHYLHKFLRREDEVRTQLLNNMAVLLAQKLDKMGK